MQEAHLATQYGDLLTFRASSNQKKSEISKYDEINNVAESVLFVYLTFKRKKRRLTLLTVLEVLWCVTVLYGVELQMTVGIIYRNNISKFEENADFASTVQMCRMKQTWESHF